MFFRTTLWGRWLSMLKNRRDSSFLKLVVETMSSCHSYTSLKNFHIIRTRFGYKIRRLGHSSYLLLKKKMFPSLFEKLDVNAFNCEVYEFAQHHKTLFSLKNLLVNLLWFTLMYRVLWEFQMFLVLNSFYNS